MFSDPTSPLSLTMIVATIATSPLRLSSLREVALILLGFIIASIWKLPSRDNSEKTHSSQDKHAIRSVEELRKLLPPGIAGSSLQNAPNVISSLDNQMMEFISQSPLFYLITYDPSTKMPFCSPKGDAPGFVKVSSTGNKHTLVIPDRPGNRQLFGLQNILQHKETTVLFQVPGSPTTLRVGGTARLSRDPTLLKQHVAKYLLPELMILLEVDHAFFHCNKAYERSKFWDTRSWPANPQKVCFDKYYTKAAIKEIGLESSESKPNNIVRESMAWIRGSLTSPQTIG